MADPNPSKETMKSNMKKTIVAFSIVTLAASSAHATTIFSHTFDGGTDDLNGTTVNGDGSGNWVAPALFDQNGDFNVTDKEPLDLHPDLHGRGLATVAFTPVDGFIYTLEASLGGFTGGNDWLAFGFANATSVDYGSRHSDPARGRAWALVRGSGNGDNQSFLVGTGSGLSWESAANTWGGNIDLRMVLDTTAGTGGWKVTMFADTGSGFIQTRAETLLSNEDIGAVGFSTGNETVVGSINSISLTSAIPGPSTPFDTWAAGFAPDDVSDPTLDFDSDGLSNLQEFAFGFDPTVSDGAGPLTIDNPGPSGSITQNGPPQIYVDPVTGQYFLRYTRRTDYIAAGLTYTAQFAADSLGAGDFENVTGGSVVGTGTGAGGVDIEAVAIEFPDALPVSGKKARFGRVGVTMP